MNSASDNCAKLGLGRRVAPSDSLPTRSSLLGRLRNLGDGISWQRFFDTYWYLLYNVARKSGLSESDAEEVVQETIISVARKIPDFQYDPAKGSFKQWLLLIARRRIQDQLRRHYRTRRSDDAAFEHLPNQETAPPQAPDAQFDAVWEQEWRENILRSALERLSQRVNPKHYQVFEHCVMQKLPAPAVARMLNLNAAQVYLAKHRMTLAVKRTMAEIEAEFDRASSGAI
jgi:RNA polymerase sigma factor (sigma-70 family)